MIIIFRIVLVEMAIVYLHICIHIIIYLHEINIIIYYLYIILSESINKTNLDDNIIYAEQHILLYYLISYIKHF